MLLLCRNYAIFSNYATSYKEKRGNKYFDAEASYYLKTADPVNKTNVSVAGGIRTKGLERV